MTERQPHRENDLEPLEHGVMGRIIPVEELELDIEEIKRFAAKSGSSEFADFIYRLYDIDPKKSSK